MSRPFKCCRVCCVPGVTYFKPAGIPLRVLDENRISVEEMEAIRLRDLEHLEQVQGAQKMNISRPTFQRILASARKKIADSLLSGKALRIEGGNYELAASRFRCSAGHEWDVPSDVSQNPKLCPICSTSNIFPTPAEREPSTKIAPLVGQEIVTQLDQKYVEEKDMKIAVVTEDELTISQHFGRAPWYMVFTVENEKISGKEKRAKMGHSHFAGQEGPHATGGGQHGYDMVSQNRHASMADAIADCQVLIAGGMGMGAFDSMKSYNIEPVVTDVKNIEEAIKLYLQGKLPNLMERLH